MARILVIDDCKEFGEVVCNLLVEEGHIAFYASSPAQGRQFCEQEDVDVIFCDLVMPVEDEGDSDSEIDSAMVGVHAIHEFSTNYPLIPIVAISGQMETQPLRAIMNFGAVGSLTKPFGQEGLLNVLKSALLRREENLCTSNSSLISF